MATMHVKIELDADTLARAIKELKLTTPPKFVLNHSGVARNTNAGKGEQQVRGLYSPKTNIVSIASQRPSSSQERLIELTRHVSFTVLHELRHAYQREYWTVEQHMENSMVEDYHMKPEEIDANLWAEYARPKYLGLVKITRRPVGGKTAFQRLSSR
jgi:hypothetical protein